MTNPLKSCEYFCFYPIFLLKVPLQQTLQSLAVTGFDTKHLLLHSCQVLEQYKTDIQTFCSIEKTREELIAAMNPLFRATLLDGITMLELIGQTELAEQFKQIQKPFLSAIRKGQPVVLREILDVQAWQTAIDQYIALITATSQS